MKPWDHLKEQCYKRGTASGVLHGRELGMMRIRKNASMASILSRARMKLEGWAGDPGREQNGGGVEA